jgi:rubrerythrin
VTRHNGRPPASYALRAAARVLQLDVETLEAARGTKQPTTAQLQESDDLRDVAWYLRSKLLPQAERRELAARSREREKQQKLGKLLRCAACATKLTDGRLYYCSDCEGKQPARCECGASLLHYVGAGAAGVLCPECDQEHASELVVVVPNE